MRRTLLLLSALPAGLLAPTLALAQSGDKLISNLPNPISGAGGWGDAQPPTPGRDIPVRVFFFNTAHGYLYSMITILFGLVGIGLFAAFTYAAYLWMTSLGGDGVKKAKTIIIEATVGLVVMLLSYLIVQTLTNNLGSFRS